MSFSKLILSLCTIMYNFARRLLLLQENPYEQHLELLITNKCIPFRSVEDIKNGQTDSKMAIQIFVLICIVSLNVGRFLVLVIYPTTFVKHYFIQYFPGQENSWYFHLGVLIFFCCPTLICKFD